MIDSSLGNYKNGRTLRYNFISYFYHRETALPVLLLFSRANKVFKKWRFSLKVNGNSLTPFIAFKALVVNPLFLGISPLFYIAGVLLVAMLLTIHYNIYSDDKYGKYMILWGILNMTIFSYIFIYALYDLRNMKWGTR